MPAPWRRNRRSRYSDRGHDVTTRPVASVATSEAPQEITWRAVADSRVAHAFSSGPGWMRSVCRRERWTVAWGEVPEEAERCTACADLVAVEIPESELRAMDGNR